MHDNTIKQPTSCSSLSLTKWVRNRSVRRVRWFLRWQCQGRSFGWNRSTSRVAMWITKSPVSVTCSMLLYLRMIAGSNQCYLPVRQKVAGRFSEFKCCRSLRLMFPFLAWARRYSVRRDLPLDIISGCTVAIMHIPQGEKRTRSVVKLFVTAAVVLISWFVGMGYALLANMPAIMGIYTAFFPVLAFFLFGTSRHNSMGEFN